MDAPSSANFQVECRLLPAYTASPPPPTYSSDLAEGERSLQNNASRSNTAPSGIYTETCDGVSLVLLEQEPNIDIPSYDRRAVVNGAIELENRTNISKVVLKFEGHLKSRITGQNAGSRVIKVVDETYTLWERQHSGQSCTSPPSSLPFSTIFPTTFRHDDKSWTLPPSYNLSFHDLTGVASRCTYTLTVVISGLRRPLLSLSPKTKTLKVVLNYNPRKRPEIPILTTPSFFSTIKTCPEDWSQSMTTMNTRPSFNLAPLQSHFFTPAVQVYGLSDRIPFHIQLEGPQESLKQLLAPDDILPSSTPKTFRQRGPSSEAKINVILIRQLTVEVKGTTAWRNLVIGEAELRSIPPPIETSQSEASNPSGSSIGSANWEGEIQCRDDVKTGGFFAPGVCVKDFIALTITPPRPPQSPFLSLKSVIPVQFVTDSWADTFASEDEMGLI